MKKLIIIALILCTSCTNTWQGIKEGAKKDTAKYRQKAAMKLYPEAADEKAPEPPKTETICQKSWTDVTCYEVPLK